MGALEVAVRPSVSEPRSGAGEGVGQAGQDEVGSPLAKVLDRVAARGHPDGDGAGGVGGGRVQRRVADHVDASRIEGMAVDLRRSLYGPPGQLAAVLRVGPVAAEGEE